MNRPSEDDPSWTREAYNVRLKDGLKFLIPFALIGVSVLSSSYEMTRNHRSLQHGLLLFYYGTAAVFALFFLFYSMWKMGKKSAWKQTKKTWRWKLRSLRIPASTIVVCAASYLGWFTYKARPASFFFWGNIICLCILINGWMWFYKPHWLHGLQKKVGTMLKITR